MALLPQAWLSLHKNEGIRTWRRGAEIPPRPFMKTFSRQILSRHDVTSLASCVMDHPWAFHHHRQLSCRRTHTCIQRPSKRRPPTRQKIKISEEKTTDCSDDPTPS